MSAQPVDPGAGRHRKGVVIAVAAVVTLLGVVGFGAVALMRGAPSAPPTAPPTQEEAADAGNSANAILPTEFPTPTATAAGAPQTRAPPSEPPPTAPRTTPAPSGPDSAPVAAAPAAATIGPGGADSTPAAAASGAAPSPIAAGRSVFTARCAACHTAANHAPNRVGPNLFGVAGRAAASVPNFNYSPALRSSGITWTSERLQAFIQAPMRTVPGTRMTFVGIRDQEQAEALVAYLESLH